MIDKKEDINPSIGIRGLNESCCTTSMENVDQKIKQLQAQKLQAQSNISSSFKELFDFLVAREKRLLRQVDVMHDHVILCLQSRKSLLTRNLHCYGNEDNALELTDSCNSSSGSSNRKDLGIQFSFDTKELLRQINMFGEVEMIGTSFLHLSEDNETFPFPYRVQSYQETCEDHMLLYKSVNDVGTCNSLASVAENPNFERLVDEEYKSVETREYDVESKTICRRFSDHIYSPLILGEDEVIRTNVDSPKLLAEEDEHNLEKEMRNVNKGLRKFAEERSEDVRHWMHEILHETNPEPPSNDPDLGRFDFFTVLKCSPNEDDFHKKNLQHMLGKNMECFPEKAESNRKYSED